MAEKRAGVRLVSKPRPLRREAVVSLDASRTPAMLFDVGIGSSGRRLCSKYFRYAPSRRFLLYIEGKISRGSPEPPWQRNLPVGYRHCGAPVDSPNVPKSTSRRFRHFMQFLRGFLEVKKKKRFFGTKQQMRLVRFLYE